MPNKPRHSLPSNQLFKFLVLFFVCVCLLFFVFPFLPSQPRSEELHSIIFISTRRFGEGQTSFSRGCHLGWFGWFCWLGFGGKRGREMEAAGVVLFPPVAPVSPRPVPSSFSPPPPPRPRLSLQRGDTRGQEAFTKAVTLHPCIPSSLHPPIQSSLHPSVPPFLHPSVPLSL